MRIEACLETDVKICPLPWTHLSTDTRGSVRPCCVHQNRIVKEDNSFLYVDEVPLKEIFQHDYMKKLRQKFRENKKPEACQICWNDESNGKVSKRQVSIHFLGYKEDDLQKLALTEPTDPSYLQLIATNKCNLKCRTCNPNSSSKWIAEGKERGLYLYNADDNREVFREDSVLSQTTDEWFQNLKILEIMGGEPFLQKDVENMLYDLVKKNISKKITVSVSSNATYVPTDMIRDLRNQFKFLGVSLSIDGINQKFEYMRHGGRWADVEKNIEKYYELSFNNGRFAVDFAASVTITISMMNVFYIPEIIQYFENKFPKMLVFTNMVYDPKEYDCANLPEYVKKEIRNEYQKYHGHTKMWSTLEAVLNHLESKNHDELTFQAGLVALHDGDLYRKESFAKDFPEFYALIEKDWQLMLINYVEIKKSAFEKKYLMIDSNPSKVLQPTF